MDWMGAECSKRSQLRVVVVIQMKESAGRSGLGEMEGIGTYLGGSHSGL